MKSTESKAHEPTVFERFAERVTRASGSPAAFLVAASVIIIWALSGPIFAFSNTWQLFVNTGTTVATFLMVFLIQHAQNKASLAVQLKLNELIAALEGASNRLVDVEDLSEKELVELHRRYEALAQKTQGETNTRRSVSVEEAPAGSHKNTSSGG